MATSTCDLQPSDYAQLISDQNTIIKLAVVKHIAFNDPYSNLVFQDTFESGYGETQTYAATPRAAMNQSLTEPDFTPYSESCQLNMAQAKYGNYNYSATPGVLQGQTNPICVRQQYFAVERLLSQSVEMLKRGVSSILSADLRANFLNLSGTKFVVPTPGGAPEGGLTGSEWAVSTAFAGGLPGDRLTFQYAKWLRDLMVYDYEPELFGEGADSYAVLVTSQELNDALRTDAPVNNALVASTTGSFKDGHDGLWKYAFIDYNFRGLKFAIDPKPLRFDQVDGAGFPILIEPYLQVATNAAGLTWKTNPAWQNASYEVAFLFTNKNAFARLTPERYSGEGEAKWPSGFFGGELVWRNYDESCNPWQDFGWFQYRIVRAVVPQAPHMTAAILTKRCRGSFTDATDTCPDLSDQTDEI